MIILNYDQIEIFNTMKQKWWFAPEIIKHATELNPNAVGKIKGSHKIKRSSNLSIVLKRVYVHKSYDTNKFFRKHNDKNDLFIATKFQTGTNPLVQRVHKYEEKRKIGHVGPFFKSVVCSFSDFRSNDIILNTQVYDIDSWKYLKEHVDDVSNLIGSAGIFPALVPYVPMAIKFAQAFANLLEKSDSHEKIIDSNLELEIIKPHRGARILQTGHWVCFSDNMPSGLKITPTLKIINKNGESFKDCSYIVYSIRNILAEEPEWEITQKVATLLTELHGKKGRAKSAISFLTSTMEGYANFKKLNRHSEITNRKKPSKEETMQLKKLNADQKIKPFIPKKSPKQGPLVKYVNDVTSKMQEELRVLHEKYKSGELNISSAQYSKKRIKVINRYAIPRKTMEELTEKFYRSPGTRSKIPPILEGKSAREIAKMITDGIIPPRHIGKKTPEVLQQKLFSLENSYKPQTWRSKEQIKWNKNFLDTMAAPSAELPPGVRILVQ